MQGGILMLFSTMYILPRFVMRLTGKEVDACYMCLSSLRCGYWCWGLVFVLFFHAGVLSL